MTQSTTLPTAACPTCGAGEEFQHPELGAMPGYVAGRCGHRVAGSEWRAGFRVCERCTDPGCAGCIHDAPHIDPKESTVVS